MHTSDAIHLYTSGGEDETPSEREGTAAAMHNLEGGVEKHRFVSLLLREVPRSLVCSSLGRGEGPPGCLGGGALLLGALLGQEHGVHVGQHTSVGDGHTAQQLGQLLVVADGQLDVAGHDAGLLVVAGSVAGQLQHLGAQVLQHSGQVNGGTSTDALSVLALLQVAGDAAHGEGEAGLGGTGHGLLAGSGPALASACAACLACHVVCVVLGCLMRVIKCLYKQGVPLLVKYQGISV